MTTIWHATKSIRTRICYLMYKIRRSFNRGVRVLKIMLIASAHYLASPDLKVNHKSLDLIDLLSTVWIIRLRSRSNRRDFIGPLSHWMSK